MEDLSKLSKQELIARLNQTKTDDFEAEFSKVESSYNQNNPHSIPVRTKNDHKNIMLYTALNKKVGPLHPENAKRTMRRWRNAGVQLYTTPRTAEQINTFKQTDEYKSEIRKREILRKQKMKLSSKGRTQQMIAEVAAQTALAVKGQVDGS
jgi:hypothetical protein